MLRIVEKLRRGISSLVEGFAKIVIGCYRTKNNVFLECENDLDDSPRSFYEYLLRIGWNRKHKIVWSVEDEKYCNTHYHEKNVIFFNRKNGSLINRIRLYKYTNTFRYFIFSHPYWLKKPRDNQIVINTWHGTPIKDVSETDNPNLHESFDWQIVPTEQVVPWIEKTCCPRGKMVFGGAPRLDDLFQGNKEEIFGKFFPYHNGDRAIICMPTYKKSKQKEDSKVQDLFSLDVIQDENEYHELNRFLLKNNIHLFIKPHPLQVIDGLWTKEETNIHYISNRVLLEKHVILYQLIGCCDMLLSDLSSVIYDYLLLDRPIGLLTKNFDKYERGFLVENVLGFLPGVSIGDYNELIEFITDTINGKDEMKERRKEVCKMVNKLPAGNYCEEFFNMFFESQINNKGEKR